MGAGQPTDGKSPAETSERDQLLVSTGGEDLLPSQLRVCVPPPRPPRTPAASTSLKHVGTLGWGGGLCVVKLDLYMCISFSFFFFLGNW